MSGFCRIHPDEPKTYRAFDQDDCDRCRVAGREFEIDSLPVSGSELAADEGIAEDEWRALALLGVGEDTNIGGGAAPLITVRRIR